MIPGRCHLPEPAGAPPRLQEGRAAPSSLAARLSPRKAAVITITITITIAVSVAGYWLTRASLGEMAARSLSIIILAAAF